MFSGEYEMPEFNLGSPNYGDGGAYRSAAIHGGKGP